MTQTGEQGSLQFVSHAHPSTAPPSFQGKRIAIVSGSFRPGYSYQENVWAERLAGRGHDVCVFCPRQNVQEPSSLGFALRGIATRGLSHRQLYFERAVAATVARFSPDLILWFGPPQRFGDSLTGCTETGSVPMAVFMGQNRRMQAFDWRTKGLTWRQQAKAQAYRILRGPVIRRAAERADLIVANTEETADILNLYIPATQHDGLTEKTLTIPLGYDPANFEFVPGRGERVRDELKLPAHAVVALLSSRFAPEKSDSIRLILRGFRDAARRDASLHLLAVGLDDGAVSRACRLEVAEHHSEGRVHLLPFASRTRLADLYSAADIAVFARPSISCQEALGTGAYGVFADDGSMDWLLTTAECGRTFRTGDEMDLSRVLCSAATVIQSHDRQSARAERAAHAARFNYDHIIDRVLGRLAGPAAD